MSRLRLREESGQAILVTVLFLSVLCGAVALVIDVGSWYREQRQAQATADASALAGAQALPANPSNAIALAQRYATSNGGGVAGADIAISNSFEPNDSITVNAKRQAAGFFSKLFSITGVTVGATATARAGVPQQAFGVAPIVVNKLHPDLSGPGCPCFQSETTLPLGKDGAPGAFGIIDLTPNENGNAGSSTLGDWVLHGFDDYLSLGKYDSDTGAKFDSSDIESALSSRIGSELLFPVYDSLDGNGSNAQYNVIGWVAFHLDSYSAQGNSGTLTGYFTRVIWQGIQSKTNQNIPDFGVYSVSLVN
jgi:Flp pilus assembly protein TadG